MALRAAADVHHDPNHRDALRREATRCEEEGTSDAANAAKSAAASANASAYAAAAATASAYAANVANVVAYQGDDILRVAVQCALDAYAEE
jgi:hypothetical protein